MALPFSFSRHALVGTLLLLWLSAVRSDPTETVAECGPQLLLLAPCAPFVQGLMPAPVKSCCDDLGDLYSQQPQCLCLLLNNTSVFPINRTVALRLPPLCDLNTDASTCQELIEPPAASDRHTAQGATANSSIAEGPMASLHPRTTLMNGSNKTGIKDVWMLAIVVSSFILPLRCGSLEC